MKHYPAMFFALAALAVAIGTTPATAGGALCCACDRACPSVIEVVPSVTPPFYIVDQGPDLTGPGIVVAPGYVEVNTAPATYPYVGRDYYDGSYPYVRRYGVARHAVRRHARYHRHVSARRAIYRYPR